LINEDGRRCCLILAPLSIQKLYEIIDSSFVTLCDEEKSIRYVNARFSNALIDRFELAGLSVTFQMLIFAGNGV